MVKEFTLKQKPNGDYEYEDCYWAFWWDSSWCIESLLNLIYKSEKLITPVQLKDLFNKGLPHVQESTQNP